MMKKVLALFLVLAMVFLMVACSLGDFTGGTSSTNGNGGGGGTKTVKVFFKVTEENATLIGASSVTIQEGEMLDWTTVPTAGLKGCEFVGWAYDVNGERMLNVAVDRFNEDTVLYAIFQKVTESGTTGGSGNGGGTTGGSSNGSGTAGGTTGSGVVDSKPVDSSNNGSNVGSSNGNYTGSDVVDSSDMVDSSNAVGSSDVVGSTDIVDDPYVDESQSTVSSTGGGNGDDVIDTPTTERVLIIYNSGLGILDEDQLFIMLDKGDRYYSHPTPTREGYEFTGWYLDVKCTEKVTNGMCYTEDVTVLYAGWSEIVKYTVTFISDGAIVKAVSIREGETCDIYVSVEKEGYKFNGWKNGTSFWFPGDVVDSDLELIADFTAKSFDVNYYSVYGVENPNPNSYTIESLFELVDLEKEGYTFTGWYTDEELTNKVSKIVYTGEAIDLYAGWEENAVTPTPPSEEEQPPEVTTKWSGKTLNILATTWGQPEAYAPWAQAELTVGPNDWNSSAGFGAIINSAILRRAADIKTTYGVELNWINARGNHIATLLSEAIVAGSESTKYHIAMPRMLEAQTIVGTNSIYDLANIRFIDLTKSYYNQASIETYTVQEHTLFAAGDFSFLDEETSYLTYYNMAMTKGIKDFPDLYQMVKDGKWTIDQMTNVAKLVTKNTGEPEWTDNDTYGYGTINLSRFYHYSGIKQVSVGETEYGMEYIITLNDPKVSTLIDKILVIQNSEWARTSWTGSYTALQKAFEEGRLLFYDEVINKCSYFKNQNETFKVGLLPSPKLSESQDTYYTLCSYQSVVMCIPKATPDREMSGYFFEILAYTGQKHIMAAYKDNLRTFLDPNTAAESMEIIENYIFSNLSYDPGYMYGWNGLLNSVQNESYSSGYNNFDAVFKSALETANETIFEWNMAWFEYSDKIK